VTTDAAADEAAAPGLSVCHAEFIVSGAELLLLLLLQAC
jgi:hypothetical protein